MLQEAYARPGSRADDFDEGRLRYTAREGGRRRYADLKINRLPWTEGPSGDGGSRGSPPTRSAVACWADGWNSLAFAASRPIFRPVFLPCDPALSVHRHVDRTYQRQSSPQHSSTGA